MLKPATVKRVLVLIVLALVLSSRAKAQVDCYYGFNLHILDQAGATVENAKIEVLTVNKKEFVPSAVMIRLREDVYFVGAEMYGATIRGDFMLRVTAQGFDPYQRQFNFPICQIQAFELKLAPKGSTNASFERLATVSGRVLDEDGKPFANATIEAQNSDHRIYRAHANGAGYYKLDLPKGSYTIRVTGAGIAEVLFTNHQIEDLYSELNIPICLRCKVNGEADLAALRVIATVAHEKVIW